ncbi:zinc finger protein, partial [Syncephalis pseudoplumigaleata]
LDQIHDDLQPTNAEKLKSQPLDADLPGLGQFYCIECSRYFISTSAMDVHVKSKAHKKRLRELKDAPYTQAEAEAAVGL